MGFKLTHRQYFILSIFVYTLSTTVFAATNVTIVYQDPSITYSPSGAWSLSAPSKLDLGGAHMITQNPNATASFNFTGKFFFILLFFSFTVNQVDFCCFFIIIFVFIYPGIAIYFLAPLWPYLVNTAVSLDSGPITAGFGQFWVTENSCETDLQLPNFSIYINPSFLKNSVISERQ